MSVTARSLGSAALGEATVDIVTCERCERRALMVSAVGWTRIAPIVGSVRFRGDQPEGHFCSDQCLATWATIRAHHPTAPHPT